MKFIRVSKRLENSIGQCNIILKDSLSYTRTTNRANYNIIRTWMKNLSAALPSHRASFASTRKLQTYVVAQDCDKRLEIVAVLFGRGRSVIVVTIGSEVESVLKVGCGRLLRGNGTEWSGAERSSIDPRNVCQQLGQPRGCLIGWVKVTTCLPARLRDAVVSLPTYVHSRAPHHGTCLLARSLSRERARARAHVEMRL